MNSNFTVKGYSQTFIARFVLATVILGIALTGLSFTNNDVENARYYKMKRYDKVFEIIFFVTTAVVETLAMLLYLFLWVRQRKSQNLAQLNKVDNIMSCVLIVFRILVPIALSIFILSRVNKIETPNILSRIAHSDDAERKKEWDAIYKITISILIFEII